MAKLRAESERVSEKILENPILAIVRKQKRGLHAKAEAYAYAEIKRK